MRLTQFKSFGKIVDAWSKPIRHKIACIGDSHITYLAPVHPLSDLSRFYWTIVRVDGATASGLANPNSATQAGPIFRAALNELKAKDSAVFMLGEVDCGFVFWYRSAKYGVDVESQLENGLCNYDSLIRYAKRRTQKLVVLAAPPQSLEDYTGLEPVANLRATVTASRLERWKLTVLFNSRLSQLCEDIGVSFVDINTALTEGPNGRICRHFKSRDSLDHHMDCSAVGKLYRSAVLKALSKKS